ncbi:flavin reductase family protein [Paraburkholderia sediminicola]|uniref:flavin reductase family protein n=1 Tax=Paraburkholderia sediminicola TaxID=458836 RepID=UPI0038BAFD50
MNPTSEALLAANLPLAESFRAGMRRLAAGVCVVAARNADGIPLGVTATALCSLTIEPPALLVCVNLSSPLAQWLTEGAGFSVNLLGHEQEKLARVFGGMAGVPREARFDHGEWCESADGAPHLADALANFQCSVAKTTDYGTHRVVIGAVNSVALGEPAAALVYRDGSFHPLPAVQAEGSASTA